MSSAQLYRGVTMLPEEVLNKINRVIKEIWMHNLSKDYTDWYMLKEDGV